MSDGSQTKTVSTRRLRTRALAPRVAFYVVVGILSMAGIASIFKADPQPTAAAVPKGHGSTRDLGAQAFAESFARVYLSWGDGDRGDERERLLAQYLPESLDPEAGVRPGEGSVQDVYWTSVASSRRVDERVLVTVAAQTTDGLLYLNVPVQRDRRGFLYVSSYPAFVGPPPTADEPPELSPEDVDDEELVRVVERAIKNYLAGSKGNLAADLTPDAVVTLPPSRLTLVEGASVVWLERGRRVRAEIQAEDSRESAWTLSYELEVRKRDRWYVRSLQADPTFKGGP